ncbi:SDR family oxidoreductase [Rhodoferax sp.]|uniref:UDP-glucose 4-epimerase family protein n=1 Tax=Rhodoferax sp. TaxID=50421 RepID=UPI00283C8448|nr:SDR family oxidoreductase [Rhodoferax sp.]MDR3371563.1 SDR family oxidoreductase [Rhodoferax sp.]
MKILVTGATGMVGKALCQRLVDDGFAVRAAVRTIDAELATSDVAFVGDINELTDWQTALTGVDVVVHLAARVHLMRDTAENPLAEFRRINVQGALKLARSSYAVGVKRYIYVSSIKVNGEFTESGQALTELDVPNPQDAYGQSKYEAEVGLLQIAVETGMEVVIIRPPLVYGPGVKANFAALMRAVQRGWPLPLGAIHNQRSLVALDNLVDFITTCISHPNAANQTFLISDGQDLSTTELVRCMAKAAGVPARLLPVPVWALAWAGRLLGKVNGVQRLTSSLKIDSGKARNLLGWTPKITVQEGLLRAVTGNPQP